MTTFTIDGSAVHDIPSFYDEINRVFMTGEDWRLGPSLDALNDLLYGGIGALADADSVRIVWAHHQDSRDALGRNATAHFYREKLRRPDVFNADHFRQQLRELQTANGPTYFEIVLQIFAEHPEIELVLE